VLLENSFELFWNLKCNAILLRNVCSPSVHLFSVDTFCSTLDLRTTSTSLWSWSPAIQIVELYPRPSLSDSVTCSSKFVPPCTIDCNLTLKEFVTSFTKSSTPAWDLPEHAETFYLATEVTKSSTPAWDLPEQPETFYLAAAGLVDPTSTLPRTSNTHLQGTWGTHPQNGNAKGK
jgi:hypothetical protein